MGRNGTGRREFRWRRAVRVSCVFVSAGSRFETGWGSGFLASTMLLFDLAIFWENVKGLE